MEAMQDKTNVLQTMRRLNNYVQLLLYNRNFKYQK